MVIIIGIVLGLFLNYLLGGLPFSTLVCIAAAIFIILPTLLKLETNKIKNIIKHKKKIIFISLIINFIILPLLAGLLRYLFLGKTNIEILYGILLLSIIPGGGLLATYLKLTKADLNLGITLFSINLLTFGLYFIPFTMLLDFINLKQTQTYQKELENKKQINNLFSNYQTNKLLKDFTTNNSNLTQHQTQAHCVIEETSEKLGISISSCFSKNGKINPLIGLYGFLILVIFPIILLLIIKHLNLISLLKKISPIISKVGTLGIITYIFSLEQIREIFSSKFENILLKIILLTLTFYIITYILGYIISNYLLKNRTAEKLALFWNITTRFITLGLIIASVYAYYLNNFSIIIIFVISYFIQITLAGLIIKKLSSKN